MRELGQQLAKRELTSREIIESSLTAISSRDSRIGAFLHVDGDRALAAAQASDERRAAGQALGPLDGITISIKDAICEVGQPATCGSRMLKGYISPYSATAIERLLAAGAIPLGRANLDEFAMGSSSENSAYQLTHNPWDLDRTPGGSSSGSAASVAARMVPGSLGSDTGGSIRQPASLCGVVGLKPTYGRVSRYGLVAFASSLEQIGPFSLDVYGAAALLQAMAGHDPHDATSVNEPVDDYLSKLDEPLKDLRIGLPQEYFGEGLDSEVRRIVEQAIEVYRSQGATLVPIELPHSKYSVATYYIVAPSEASSNLARFDGIHYGYRSPEFTDLESLYANSRGEAFGPEVKRRIMLGTYALSAGYADKYYVKALQIRRLIRQDFDDAFQKCDLIAGPVTPTPAFKLGELVDDPLAMYLSDIYTIAANLAGIPAISVPAGWTASGLPVGLQLQSPVFTEAKLLRAARMLEITSPWIGRLPPTLS
ncbi:MAG: Asp-tRNA(Asn)/Glu-tRNA(Gln) amidotransferase GatCAB subunit A [Planctomyces sp.]|nr:Asp-tRNA(Asn)/Glu-tRNA(Gln) amidotransferase GatCAB subunit A [Planctomyces sp.]